MLICRKVSRKIKNFLNSNNKGFNFHSSKNENLIVLHCTKYAFFATHWPPIREQPQKDPTWTGLKFPPENFSAIKHALKIFRFLGIYETKPTERNKTFEINILSIFSKFEACMPAYFTKLNSSVDVFKKNVKNVELFFNKNQHLWLDASNFSLLLQYRQGKCLREILKEEA